MISGAAHRDGHGRTIESHRPIRGRDVVSNVADEHGVEVVDVCRTA